MHLKIFGKAIIAGEHAVIRGSPAVVFPLKTRFLEVSYQDTPIEFEANFEGDMKEDLSLVFWGTLEKALKILNRKHSELNGELLLNNTVAVGAGMGASATLCVGIGRFFQQKKWITEKNLYEFCRQLENLFHGESSGVDIAAALCGEPIEFQRPSKIQKVRMKWQPKFYLSYSGQRGITSECVRVVKELWELNPKEGQKIDDDMRDSVFMVQKALSQEESLGLFDMIQAINKARSCFERWGLTAGILNEHMRKVMEMGALAAKPTGSGRGGFVLSLWKDHPSLELQKKLQLISL